MPFVEGKKWALDGKLLDVFFDGQRGGFFAERDCVNVMADIQQREAFRVGFSIVTDTHCADEVLRHLFHPDDRLEPRVCLVSLGDHFFLKFLGGLTAGENAIFDLPGAALPDLPEGGVERAIKGIRVDQLGTLEQLRFVFRRGCTKRKIQRQDREEE